MPSRRSFLAAGAGGLTGLLAGCTTESPSATPTDRPPRRTTAGSPGSPGSRVTDTEPGPVGLETIVAGLESPVALAEGPAGDPLYVAERSGRISVIEDGERRDEPLLDLTDRVVTGGERGLLGLALHPAYADNRRFFVRYSAPTRGGTPSGYSHTFVLSAFTAGDDGRRVRPDAERSLLEMAEPQSNHNSGSIVFGPEGYLYVGVGDGGGGGDAGTGHVEGGNGQDVEANLLGSVLRIDVDGGGDDAPYGIPADNPLVGRAGLDEHFAWGFRNPWGMSFDDDRLLVADVGQSRFEEVDVVERGGNYGWNVREARSCYRADTCPGETPEGDPLLDPVIEYPHGEGAVSGNAVIGGHVYRGERLPELTGEYVFGDLSADGRLFRATAGPADEPWPPGVLAVADADRPKLDRLIAMGRDRDGELYALSIGRDGGGVHRLVPGS